MDRPTDYTSTQDALAAMKQLYPNVLPAYTIDEVGLARLTGQQDVIRSIEHGITAQEHRNQG